MPRCKLPDCPVAKDGRCLEGRKESCPNLIQDGPAVTVAPEEVPSTETVRTPVRPMQKLYTGVRLEISEAREFTRGSRAVVVALAGMKECGKTSLLARLHQQFQSGPVGGYNFAGSRSLLRFEEMNWLAMLDSGVQSPEMERSSRQFDNLFLHLKVRKVEGDEPVIDVLLNDISGETFPEAIAVESECEHLLCLRRADHLALLVDGASISSRAYRHDHIAKVRNFVQRVLQTGQLGKQTALHLIISKEDSLKIEPQRAENLVAVQKLGADFTQLFQGKVAKIHLWQLAARPHDGSMPTEETIGKLFGTWVDTSYRLENEVPAPYQPSRPARDFCKFGEQFATE